LIVWGLIADGDILPPVGSVGGTDTIEWGEVSGFTGWRDKDNHERLQQLAPSGVGPFVGSLKVKR